MINYLPDTEFKIMVINMLSELKGRRGGREGNE